MPKKIILFPGDTIEFGVTLNDGNYSSVKLSAKTTIQDTESADDALNRLELFVWENADRALKEL